MNIQAVKYLDPQIRLAAKAGKQKKEYKLSMVTERTFEKIENLAKEPIEAVFTDPTYGKVRIFLLQDEFWGLHCFSLFMLYIYW